MNLKKIWQDICYNLQYTPFSPEKKVQEKLESLGYSFNPVVYAQIQYAVASNQVHNSKGQLISIKNSGGDETKEYHAEYDKAVKEIRADKLTAS